MPMHIEVSTWCITVSDGNSALNILCATNGSKNCSTFGDSEGDTIEAVTNEPDSIESMVCVVQTVASIMRDIIVYGADEVYRVSYLEQKFPLAEVVYRQ